MIQQGAISSIHLHTAAVPSRDDNRVTPAGLVISNKACIDAHNRLNLVKSSYDEET